MLHLLSSPRSFSKKFQTGFHRWIILETIDTNFIGELIPAVVFNKLHDDTLKSDSMHGVIRLLATHT